MNIIGIDLGTTNSVAALARQPRQLAADPDGSTRLPSVFRHYQREATREACRQAGCGEVFVIDEPVATALAYVDQTGRPVGRAAVYDLGGGTFDLAVVDCSASPPRVLACQGDRYLGGDDIDRALADWVRDQVLREHSWDLHDDFPTYDRLVMECERAKIRLCHTERARIELAEVDPAAPVAAHGVVLDRARLASLCRELVQRTFLICDEVLSTAGVRASDLDEVLVAGGSSQLPMVQEDLARYFGRTPRCDFDPGEVIAIGASVANERLLANG